MAGRGGLLARPGVISWSRRVARPLATAGSPWEEDEARVFKPAYDAEAARALFERHWGRALGAATAIAPLPSYDDMNWRVEVGATPVVLKIAAERAACLRGYVLGAARSSPRGSRHRSKSSMQSQPSPTCPSARSTRSGRRRR